MRISDIHNTRILKLRERLRTEGLDTLLVSNPENRRYLSGFTAVDPQFTESSGFLFVTDDVLLLATDFRYKEQAETEVADFDIFLYQDELLKSLKQIVKRLKTRRLGFESGYFTYALFEKIRALFEEFESPIELIPTDNMVERLRVIKDSYEIDIIKKSLQITESVFEEVIANLKPGISERELAYDIENLIKTKGAEGVAFPPIVASGPNSSMPHATPTDRKIQAHEPIIIDMGAKFEGYCSDMTRTMFVSKPHEKIQEIYRIVRKAQLYASQNIKSGMTSREADSLARDVISQSGYGDYFGHSLGHGVGLATHEAPSLNPNQDTILTENMIFTVEPGIYLPGIGGVRLENMVLIKENKAIVLNRNDAFYDGNFVA